MIENCEYGYLKRLKKVLDDLRWELHLAVMGQTGEEEELKLKRKIKALELKILQIEAFFGLL